MKVIESTGQILTIQQREKTAVYTIRHALARLEQQTDSLGRHKAARKIQEAIEELEEK